MLGTSIGAVTNADGRPQGASLTVGRASASQRPVTDSSAKRMHLMTLKARIDDSAYVIDPHNVAEALLRRTDPRRDPLFPPPAGELRIIRSDARAPRGEAPARER
jgi:anti-sigma28 factor (negative regulator of flagellin synthesis)